MKSRKQIWLSVVCLVSLLTLALAFTARTSSVHAARHMSSLKPSALAQPAAYVAGPSIRAAFAADSMLLNSAGADRIGNIGPPNGNPLLPPVEQFTLTPPNPEQRIYKTILTVRFVAPGVERLSPQFPMTLGNQHVVLQRSADDPRSFSTQLDFDWDSFARDQQARKEAANAGRMVPVFAGRDFLRIEPMQFLDPAEIEGALQSHQAIQFTPQILTGGVANVLPENELMMASLPVVEDAENGSGRTYDACLQNLGENPGNPNGAWTFNTLMLAIANTSSEQVAEQMLNNMLSSWQSNQAINGFPASEVPARAGIGQLGVPGSGLLGNWPLDGALPSLLNAPVRLNAIVNRIDLAGQPGENQAGELRFIFGVSAGTGTVSNGNGACAGSNGKGPLFNIILEFKVPSNITAQQWASDWNNLLEFTLGPTFDAQLQRMTDQVVQANSCAQDSDGPSCLFHVRTNEVELGTLTLNLWEQREFKLVDGTLQEVTVDMTPNNGFNTTGLPACSGLPTPCSGTNTLGAWINQNQATIVEFQGTQPVVPGQFPTGSPFLGGSAFNGGGGGGNATAFWNDPTISGPNGATARRYFSLNTCDGCHGRETQTIGFQQVVNRAAGSAVTMSNFLLGCQNNNCNTSSQCTLATLNLGSNGECRETVADPVNGNDNLYGDIAFRVSNLQSILNNSSPAGGLLLPFVRPHIGVH